MGINITKEQLVPMRKETFMTTTPVFDHDCRTCKFLGHAVIDGKAADFYVCEHDRLPDKNMNDLLWRHSDRPDDYGSTFVALCTPLSPFAALAFALYIQYLGCNGANALIKGTYSKDGKVMLNLDKA